MASTRATACEKTTNIARVVRRAALFVLPCLVAVATWELVREVTLTLWTNTVNLPHFGVCSCGDGHCISLYDVPYTLLLPGPDRRRSCSHCRYNWGYRLRGRNHKPRTRRVARCSQDSSTTYTKDQSPYRWSYCSPAFPGTASVITQWPGVRQQLSKTPGCLSTAPQKSTSTSPSFSNFNISFANREKQRTIKVKGQMNAISK